MVWPYVKRKLRELNPEELKDAAALFSACDKIFQDMQKKEDLLPRLTGSLIARCKVCVELKGQCLNGHWKKVHDMHRELDPENTPEEPNGIDE
jgi:hypothetical protein